MTTPDRTAILAVDIQRDFCENGSLAVAGGADVATNVTRLLADNPDRYGLVVATRDWHTDQTEGHFAPEGTDPDFADTWPVHCMADDSGSDYHPNLDLDEYVEVFKGQFDAAYSGFEGKTDAGVTLAQLLRDQGITHVEIVGIAYDVCVAATALDAVREGFTTTVLRDLTAAVSDDGAQEATAKMVAAGVDVRTSPLLVA